MTKQNKVLLAIRIDPGMMKDIEHFAGKKDQEKTEFVRTALSSFISEVEDESRVEAVKDYLWGRIGERDLMDYLEIKKIDSDMRMRRLKNLEQIGLHEG